MEDYTWQTTEPMLTNECTMSDFLNSNYHFYSRFDIGAQVALEDGTYAEVKNGDGRRFAVNASGNGDFYNHKVTFELLS
jgi:hypothetical protein